MREVVSRQFTVISKFSVLELTGNWKLGTGN